MRLYPFTATFQPSHRLVVEFSNSEPLSEMRRALLPPNVFHLPVGCPVTRKVYRDVAHPSRLVLPFTTDRRWSYAQCSRSPERQLLTRPMPPGGPPMPRVSAADLVRGGPAAVQVQAQAVCLVEPTDNTHDARLTLWGFGDGPPSQYLGLTWQFWRSAQGDIFSMTHHVECVAILEPAAKGV
ncbi:hypothetical protein AB0P36_08260 [Streptomyces flavidovirens]|uniref:hypothetical protein n=1 Tax=Streptomyces flavidovirens TaxID=67298 RepID=UPI00343E4DAB